jgi:DNA-binding NarL/FixJ family response regulator
MLNLSPLQETILRLAASGLTNKQIASQLDMGLRTVELRLLECRNRLAIKEPRRLMAWAGKNLEGVL